MNLFNISKTVSFDFLPGSVTAVERSVATKMPFILKSVSPLGKPIA